MKASPPLTLKNNNKFDKRQYFENTTRSGKAAAYRGVILKTKYLKIETTISRFQKNVFCYFVNHIIQYWTNVSRKRQNTRNDISFQRQQFMKITTQTDNFVVKNREKKKYKMANNRENDIILINLDYWMLCFV